VPGDLFAFGPFQLDAHARRLTRDGEVLALTARQFDLLHLLVSRAGETLSKDLLIEAAWRDVAVTDNSLEQAISSLRRTLTPPSGQPFIETQARRGYRFAAEVTRLDRRETDQALDALLAPHRAWIEGRAALETLERDQILSARTVFEDVLTHVPDQATAHVGLANACAMQFEMTRTDESPDRAAIEHALHHAREACRLDPQYGEAWATLGFVLDRTGRHADALAALRRAVALESDNWRHHLRLSYAGWAEERLREARRTLALLPGCPLAHWLAATVHVARQALGEAERELAAGIEALELGGTAQSRFSGVALHWLLGLLHLSRGNHQQAREAFDRELSVEGRGHLYARECCANTWYAIGALEMQHGRVAEAGAAFGEALRRLPLHPMARIGLAAIERGTGQEIRNPPADQPMSVDRAVAHAAALVLSRMDDARRRAVQVVDEALTSAPPGSAGWMIPLEPLLAVNAHPESWAPVLARLRGRAA
jgi:DNA-binding winged helix-turn-helix (wHTH) protein